jgi:hypothetical protein
VTGHLVVLRQFCLLCPDVALAVVLLVCCGHL